MMNILVGILGSNYERYEEQSRALFVRERARIIMILSARPWLSHVWNKDGMQDGYLYFMTKETPNTEDERSTRKALQLSTEEALKPLKKKIEQIESLEAKLEAKLEANVHRLDGKLEQIQKQNESLEAKVDGKFEQILQALQAERADPM